MKIVKNMTEVYALMLLYISFVIILFERFKKIRADVLFKLNDIL